MSPISAARWTATAQGDENRVEEGIPASDQVHRGYQDAIQVVEADRKTDTRADYDHLIPFIDLRKYRRASYIVPRKDRPYIQTNAEPVNFHTEGTSTSDSEIIQDMMSLPLPPPSLSYVGAAPRCRVCLRLLVQPSDAAVTGLSLSRNKASHRGAKLTDQWSEGPTR